ncbi:MAG: hypothetical protein LBQ71_00780 [Hungatella sp.]|jgi:hypothetical protein|nr:hypothetical protein [Hungatella sp.]
MKETINSDKAREENSANASNIEISECKIREETYKWVGEFLSVPCGVISKLFQLDDEVVEITPLSAKVYDYLLPMWRVLWCFSNEADNSWLDDTKNLQAMADCGFRVYAQEDYGYIFGIDGAGYDFYEAHWIHLYKARWLR